MSPDYLVHPGEYIPAVGTLADTPPVQGNIQVYFTLYLPSGAKPAGGWPIVLAGGGASGNQHVEPTIFASKMASHGLATIGISHVGQGFGPLGRLPIARAGLPALDFPDAGRGIDQNGDNIYSPLEGSEAAAPRTWTISLRDAHRQTVIDFMQLVRVIEVGMDVNGDFSGRYRSGAHLLPGRLGRNDVRRQLRGARSEHCRSLVHGRRRACSPSTCGGSPFAARRRRRAAARVPPLINAGGITSIDGVAVAAPHFNENKPLRDQPVVDQHRRWRDGHSAGAGVRRDGRGNWHRHGSVGEVPARAPLAGSYPKVDPLSDGEGGSARGQSRHERDRPRRQSRGPDDASTATTWRLLANPTIPKNPHLFAGAADESQCDRQGDLARCPGADRRLLRVVRQHDHSSRRRRSSSRRRSPVRFQRRWTSSDDPGCCAWYVRS